MCVCVFVGGGVGFRYNEYRETEEPEEDVRVMFADAADETTDISNALALDMTYRMLYYGQHNEVGWLGFHFRRKAVSFFFYT